MQDYVARGWVTPERAAKAAATTAPYGAGQTLAARGPER